MLLLLTELMLLLRTLGVDCDLFSVDETSLEFDFTEGVGETDLCLILDDLLNKLT